MLAEDRLLRIAVFAHFFPPFKCYTFHFHSFFLLFPKKFLHNFLLKVCLTVLSVFHSSDKFWFFLLPYFENRCFVYTSRVASYMETNKTADTCLNICRTPLFSSTISLDNLKFLNVMYIQNFTVP